MKKTKPNQPSSNKKKISPADIVLMLVAIFLMFRTPWSNMDSFHFLLLFLYILCIMMRISNMRKRFARQAEAARAKAEKEATTLLPEVPVKGEAPGATENTEIIETVENLEATTEASAFAAEIYPSDEEFTQDVFPADEGFPADEEPSNEKIDY